MKQDKYKRLVKTYEPHEVLYPEWVVWLVNQLTTDGWRMAQIDEGDEEWGPNGPVIDVVIWLEREPPSQVKMEDI